MFFNVLWLTKEQTDESSPSDSMAKAHTPCLCDSNRHAVPQLQTGVGFSMHEAQHNDQQESLDTLPAADASLYATQVI